MSWISLLRNKTIRNRLRVVALSIILSLFPLFFHFFFPGCCRPNFLVMGLSCWANFSQRFIYLGIMGGFLISLYMHLLLVKNGCTHRKKIRES